MNYQNEILKKDKNDITKNKINDITNEYFEALSTFIMENDDEIDKVMRIEKSNYKNNETYIIRHDLDFSRNVNLEKVKQSILNNTSKGLTSFEKRARKLLIIYIKKMIDIYGMENLKNNKSEIKKEIVYGSFSMRIESKSQDNIKINNKIGNLYGQEAIKYINNLLLLEEYTIELFNYSNNPNEKDKLKKILDKIKDIKEKIPTDIIIRQQKNIANRNVFMMGINGSFDTIESIKNLKEKMNSDYSKRLELHYRLLKFKSIAFECLNGDPEKGYARLKSPEEQNSFNRFLERINKKIKKGNIIDFSKSGFETELQRYNEELKKIEYYSQKIYELQARPQKDIISETLNNENFLAELKEVYTEYSIINKEMLINRLDTVPPEKVDTLDENRLMLIHFIPTPEIFGKEFNTQRIEDFNLDNRIKSVLRLKISIEKGRKYNQKLDKKRIKELYKKTRDQFDYSYRMPVKSQYLLADGRTFVITKPTTNISMSTAKYGKMTAHLNRKIGVGILKDDVSPESIYTINIGYNLENDRNIFGYHNLPISCLEKGVNETMVDSKKIRIGYIIVIKDEPEFEKSDFYKKAKEISETYNLPLVVYDQYEIDRKKIKNSIEER